MGNSVDKMPYLFPSNESECKCYYKKKIPTSNSSANTEVTHGHQTPKSLSKKFTTQIYEWDTGKRKK